MTTRPACDADGEAILALIRTTPALPQWTLRQLALPGDRTGPASPLVRRMLVADTGDRIAGFALVSVLLDEAELEGMAVRSDWQRRGVGRQLLKGAIELARNSGAGMLRLEVRRGNASAISLYKAAGFQVAGERSAYYVEPVEDAVLLKLRIEARADCPVAPPLS